MFPLSSYYILYRNVPTISVLSYCGRFHHLLATKWSFVLNQTTTMVTVLTADDKK
jgi:hypothetical protein